MVMSLWPRFLAHPINPNRDGSFPGRRCLRMGRVFGGRMSDHGQRDRMKSRRLISFHVGERRLRWLLMRHSASSVTLTTHSACRVEILVAWCEAPGRVVRVVNYCGGVWAAVNCGARRRRNDDAMHRTLTTHSVIVTTPPRLTVHPCSHAAAVINDPHYPATRQAQTIRISTLVCLPVDQRWPPVCSSSLSN